MDLSARSYALNITKTADTLGVPLPAGYLEHIKQAEALDAAVAEIATVSAGQLNTAVIAALEAGRDHHTDKTVQHLLLDRTLASQGIEYTARARANEALQSTLVDVADECLEAWARVLDKHSDALTVAAQAGLDLTDADAAVARGGDAMRQLHAAQVAVKAWAAATAGFGAFAAVSGVTYSEHTAPLILTPARLAALKPAYEMARDERTDDIDAWNLARNEIPLSFATIGEFMARAATFEADRQDEARDYAQRREQAGFHTR